MNEEFIIYLWTEQGFQKQVLPNETFDDGSPVYYFNKLDAAEWLDAHTTNSGEKERADEFFEDPFEDDILLDNNTILIVRL